MSEKQTWLDAVRRVVQAVAESDVAELSVTRGDFSVHLRRNVGAMVAATGLGEAPSVAAAADAHLHRVAAPLTGVFYRAPSPTAKPYVSEGDWVDAESVVGLIETMKIFNEVTADRPGRVVRFLAEPGALTHAGEPLLLLEPAERSAAEPEPGI
ncbi:MAG: acetyl-CoA carboxylase biotin carboxyl carrier protein [Chloroflexi bacterium]|nr:acetyl-CoA carboxylase biotin carboxyl carrier protein [Chloroflexota bacterium]